MVCKPFYLVIPQIEACQVKDSRGVSMPMRGGYARIVFRSGEYVLWMAMYSTGSGAKGLPTRTSTGCNNLNLP